MDQGTADRVMPLVTCGENPADRPGAGGAIRAAETVNVGTVNSGCSGVSC